MMSLQSLKIYEILQKHFQNDVDAKKGIFLRKDDKVDMIKWMVGLWIAQMAAIIGLYIRK